MQTASIVCAVVAAAVLVALSLVFMGHLSEPNFEETRRPFMSQRGRHRDRRQLKPGALGSARHAEAGPQPEQPDPQPDRQWEAPDPLFTPIADVLPPR
jgi:hypothetical protein